MKKTLITVLVIIILIVLAVLGLSNPKEVPTSVPVATSTTPVDSNPLPHIDSISQTSGPIGTILELKGTNLAGFEGDLDAVIENEKGETAYLKGIGSVPREDQTIRVKIESKVCTLNNSYSGLPCEKYLDITPGIYFIYTSPWGKISNKVQFNVTTTDQTVLNLYLQDKEIAVTSDCGATYPVSYLVPKTTSVADASLRILFSKELARYGVYKSVSIVNGVAKVMLDSAETPSSTYLGFLSSCEKMHILVVLRDTLTQYSTIKSVELYSPDGKIEF
jgi:hypothetical protein